MYKIIHNNRVVDVVRIPCYIRFLKSGNIAMTDAASAQGLVGSDGKILYCFKPITGKDYKVAILEKITEAEFNRLRSLLNSDNASSVNNLALKAARQNKIAELSVICKDTITDGFSVRLSDNQLHYFRLTSEDQLNLMLLENQLNSDLDVFVYHATNQPCRTFTREDMSKIIKAFRTYVTYHTTYFNVAKQYLYMITDIDEINDFIYGDDVISIVSDDQVKQILSDGGYL